MPILLRLDLKKEFQKVIDVEVIIPGREHTMNNNKNRIMKNSITLIFLFTTSISIGQIKNISPVFFDSIKSNGRVYYVDDKTKKQERTSTTSIGQTRNKIVHTTQK